MSRQSGSSMSPRKPCTGVLNGGRCDVAVVATSSNAGDLPLDALYEILLRLPAKALCRLRAVCRFWRCLLSDPQFAAAHAARGRDRREPPLIIAGFYSNASEKADAEAGRARLGGRHVVPGRPGSVANIMDLSGRVVKQVRMDGHRVMSMPLNLACVRRIADGTCRLLDPATYNTTDAAMRSCYYVRDGEEPIFCDNGIHLFGQVASTGEYKALRKVNRSHVGEYGLLYEVCTLISGGGRPRWRAVEGPPDTICQTPGMGVAIGGVVYLLIAAVYFAVRSSTNPADVQRDWIYSFDLETEQWLPNIKGPPQEGFFNDPALPRKFYCGVRFSLANLNGSLVIVHGPSPDTSMDLWFLVDSEKSLWVKKYSIQLTMERLPGFFQPLVVLDDGRLVVVTTLCGTGLQSLEIHDPRTKSFSTVAEIGRCCAISVYTGNLLNLGWWQTTDNEKEEREEVMHDGAERTQNVSIPGLVTGLCQINSFCGLADAFLYVMTAWKTRV